MRSVDDLRDEALGERPPPNVLGSDWRATTFRIWEQCTAMDASIMNASARGPLVGVDAELRALAEATAAALDAVAEALHQDLTPPPSAARLEPLKVSLLRKVRALEEQAWSLPFSEALQVFTFVNGMSVIATRLTDLGSDRPDDPADDEPGAPQWPPPRPLIPHTPSELQMAAGSEAVGHAQRRRATRPSPPPAAPGRTCGPKR